MAMTTAGSSQVLLSTLLLLDRVAVSWPKWPQLPYSSVGLAGNESWMMEFGLWAGLRGEEDEADWLPDLSEQFFPGKWEQGFLPHSRAI